jgi:hypothetical protein
MFFINYCKSLSHLFHVKLVLTYFLLSPGKCRTLVNLQHGILQQRSYLTLAPPSSETGSDIFDIGVR